MPGRNFVMPSARAAISSNEIPSAANVSVITLVTWLQPQEAVGIRQETCFLENTQCPELELIRLFLWFVGWTWREFS